MTSMGLRSDLKLLPLDDDVIAFSEQAQCLLGLNESAALIVRGLQQRVAAAEIARSLADKAQVPQPEAEQWIAATLDALRAHGMLGDGPAVSAAVAEEADAPAGVLPYERFEPERQLSYRLLDTHALIRFGRAFQADWVHSVLGHLATDGAAPPDIVIDIRATDLPDGELRSDVYRDGTPMDCAMRVSRLAPVVKSVLWQAAINAHDFMLYVHAGVVGMDESCVLFPAAPGSGKSSLTVALVHRGFGYFSDEVALIGPAFQVSPMPLAMAIKEPGWDLIARYYPRLMRRPVHIRHDAKAIRYLPPPADALRRRPLPVSHIIFPRFDPSARTALEPMTRAEALRRLIDECLAMRLSLDEAKVRRLMGWIGGIACFGLAFSSLDEAVELVSEATGFA